MTQRVTRNDGWTSLARVTDDDLAADTGTRDLIDVLDAVDIPIVVLGNDCRLVRFNKAASDVLRLSQLDIGQASRDTAVFAGWTRLEEQCGQVITSGVESRADLRDGDKWFVVRISPYPTGDRPGCGTVLTFTNVTAFRASIDQAIYERECTKAILNTIDDPLAVLSADQRIRSGNRAFYTMFFELTSLRAQLKEILAGNHASHHIEVDHVFPGDGQRKLKLDARPLSWPGHSERRVLVRFQDITACKQAEANDLRAIAERKDELWRSAAFLAEAQRLSVTGSFSWAVTTDEIMWSAQLYRIFELDPGMPVTLELIDTRVHPEDIVLLHDILELAQGTGTDFEHEFRLQMLDQSIKYLHMVAHGTRDGDGRLEYIGAIQDVTQRRLSEEALGKVRSELAHVARISSLGVLTASIAHEVNQPLSGVITNASTCLRMLSNNPPNIDGARETARRAIRDGNRTSDVITRLRALFGKKGLSPEVMDLNEATQEVASLLLSELQRNRVILRQDLADHLPTVVADRIQLQQVIMNLLRNASEAMSAVDDRSRELLIRTEREEEDRVRLSVTDAGLGFTAHDTDKLFDAFYTTKHDGMGIGLSVSRSIIEAHHGRLWATHNDGPGATFSFAIPCAPEVRSLTTSPSAWAVERSPG